MLTLPVTSKYGFLGGIDFIEPFTGVIILAVFVFSIILVMFAPTSSTSVGAYFILVVIPSYSGPGKSVFLCCHGDLLQAAVREEVWSAV